MNRDILIVTALSEEYVDDKYTVIYTGVGKVNASINLYSYLSKNKNIKLVINVGTAGGINCKKGQIIECGIFEDGQLEYPGSIDEVIVFDESKSKILTFDNFICKKPKKDCECVDMESFALAKVCKLLNVNFKCVKYITDIVGKKNQKTEWVNNVESGKDLLKKQIEKIIKSQLTSEEDVVR